MTGVKELVNEWDRKSRKGCNIRIDGVKKTGFFAVPGPRDRIGQFISSSAIRWTDWSLRIRCKTGPGQKPKQDSAEVIGIFECNDRIGGQKDMQWDARAVDFVFDRHNGLGSDSVRL